MLQSDRDLLVCIFQRGAADGLNAVVPYGDPDYYAQRTNINVASNDVIKLDPGPAGFFGLHPALAPLKPIYDLGDLALVHATGVPHGSRSHFTAQGLVERGVVDKAGPNTGWLGRHMNNSPAASSSAFRLVSISGNVAVSLFGADEPLALSNLSEFGFDQGVIDSGYLDILASLYRSTAPFQAPAQAALAAIGELQTANIAALLPENNAIYPTGALGSKLFQAGQLIKSSLPVEVICIDSDGWDHHENLPTYIDQSLFRSGRTGAGLASWALRPMASISSADQPRGCILVKRTSGSGPRGMILVAVCCTESVRIAVSSSVSPRTTTTICRLGGTCVMIQCNLCRPASVSC